MNSIIICSPSCWRKVGWSFVIHKYFCSFNAKQCCIILLTTGEDGDRNLKCETALSFKLCTCIILHIPKLKYSAAGTGRKTLILCLFYTETTDLSEFELPRLLRHWRLPINPAPSHLWRLQPTGLRCRARAGTGATSGSGGRWRGGGGFILRGAG